VVDEVKKTQPIENNEKILSNESKGDEKE